MFKNFFKLFMLFSACISLNLFASDKKAQTDDQFLEMVSRACFKFFWNESAPGTCLTLDNSKRKNVYSIAATGFGFSAMVIGAERAYKPRKEIELRVYKTLKMLNSSTRKDGMLFHYLNSKAEPSLEGYENVASTIDTGLLLMGVITAGEYFGGKIKIEAEKLYAAINWQTFIEKRRRLIKMAWQPSDKKALKGKGFFHGATWDYYTDESIIVTLLAISAPNKDHRVPGDFFYRWQRNSGEYKPETKGLKAAGSYVYSWTGALFTYQFAHLWIDFKQLGKDNPAKFGLKNVPAIDWHQNTLNATIACRQFSIDRKKQFKTFGFNSWGLTASAAKCGYYVGGFAPRGDQAAPKLDGTIAPYGAATAIMALPKESIAAMRYFYSLKDKKGKRLVWNESDIKPYGFYDSFNLDDPYVAKEYLGIDQGPMLLAIENHRSKLLIKYFMKNKHIQQGLKVIGFSGAASK